MKTRYLSFVVGLSALFCVITNAENPTSLPVINSSANAASTPAPTPSPAPAVSSPATAVAVVTVPPGTPSGPTVAVAEPAAPPTWAQDLMVTAEKLPVVGPILSKVLLWAGILAGIITTLTAAILGAVNTLIGAANLTGLQPVAQALGNFKDGKVMYWLKFFSMFNAQKTDPPAPTVQS